MNKSPAKSILPLVSNDTLSCTAAGLLMGQMVMGIAAHHDGSIAGMVLSLVFVLCGGASIALFMSHRHVESRPRTERPPVQAWLLTLGGAFIASIWVGRFL